MSDKERREKRRAGEGWEDFSSISDRYSTGVPVLKPWKPINPPDRTEDFCGRDSSRRDMADGVTPLMNSKRIALFISSAAAVAGIASIAVGFISLLLTLRSYTPWWQGNSDSLVLGSIELIIFGLFLSIIFGVLAVRNSKGIRILKEMDALSKQEASRREKEQNDQRPPSEDY